MPEDIPNPEQIKVRYPDAFFPNAAVAVKFLTAVTDGGQVTLVTIPAGEEGAPRVHRFDTGDPVSAEAMRSFIAFNETQECQVFWQPNVTRGSAFKKEDIVEVRAVVLDFDPTKGKPLEEERDKMRLKAWYFIEQCQVQPRAIVNTGGGMQVVFQLIKPIAVDETQRAALTAEYETFLKTLALTFGADTATCQIQSLFRVPGTFNWPTPAKKRDGRVRTVSDVWFDGGPRTTLAKLKALCTVKPEDIKAAVEHEVDFEGLEEHDVLEVFGEPNKLPDHIQKLLVNNPHLLRAVAKPDPTSSDTSKEDFKLCAPLVRARVPARDMALILSAYGAKTHKADAQDRLFGYIVTTVRNAIAKISHEFAEEAVHAETHKQERSKHLGRLRPVASGEWRQGMYDEAELSLVHGLLARPGLSCIYGKESEGKTFVALDIGWLVSLGKDWFGRSTKQCGVIYVAAEANRFVRYRLEALIQRYGDSKSFLLVNEQVNMFDRSLDVDPLIANIKNAAAEHNLDVGLIIIDTLSMAMIGGDENSAKDMNQLIANCQRLGGEFDANVCLVHHVGKKLNGPRGSTALPGAIDTGIMVGGSRFDVTKLRDGGEKFSAGFNLRQVPIHKDITTCVVDWFPIGGKSSGPPRDRDREGVMTALRMLRNEPSTVNQIIAKAKAEGIDMSHDRGAINRLLKASCDNPAHNFFERIEDRTGKRVVYRYRLVNM